MSTKKSPARRTGRDGANESSQLYQPVVRRLSDVQPREVEWLWPGRLPLGRVSLLVGQPGCGKSFLSLDAAARVSTGSPWPDGQPCPKGSVLLLSCEDDAADTIRPRLDAHRADCERVHLLAAIRRTDDDGEPWERLVTLLDVSAIEAAVEDLGDCRLMVVDPIGSYLGGSTDSYKDNEVRAVVGPLAAIAEKYGAAVLVVAHRRKAAAPSADDTAMGSRAFVGIARAVWHVCFDPAARGRRLLLPGKCNLAAPQTGLAFTIAGEPARIHWEEDPVALTADEAVALENAPQPRGPEPEARDAAAEWLAGELADGPRLAKDIWESWTGSEKTLKRAKAVLKVKAFRESAKGRWRWELPSGGQPGPVKKPGPLDPLDQTTGKVNGSEGPVVQKVRLLELDPLNEINGELASAAGDSTPF